MQRAITVLVLLVGLSVATLAVPPSQQPAVDEPVDEPLAASDASVAPPVDVGQPTTTIEAMRAGASPAPGMLDSDRWEPLAEPAPFYTHEVHEKVIEATADGKAYSIVLGKAVNYTAGAFIQPGRPLFVGNGPGEPATTCTLGFVLGSPGNYAITTAGHCVADSVRNAPNGNPKVSTPRREQPTELVAIGTVRAFDDDAPADDWAVIDINETLQGNVYPGVKGTPAPQQGVYDVPTTIDGYPVAGSVWPMPVWFNSHNPVNLSEPPNDMEQLALRNTASVAGLFVHEHNRTLYCQCPSTNGDSGGAVVVHAPDAPDGAALGLVSQGFRHVWTKADPVSYAGDIYDSFGDTDELLDRWEKRFAYDRGKYELAAYTSMRTVVDAVGMSVATPDTVDPSQWCLMKQFPIEIDPPGEDPVGQAWNDVEAMADCYAHVGNTADPVIEEDPGP